MNDIIGTYSPKLSYMKNGGIIDNNLNLYPIYVINIESDFTRKAYIKYLLKKEKINYCLVEVKKMTAEIINKLNIPFRQISIFGCAVSHLWCINNAIQNNYDKFIIFEDDIIFHKNYKTQFKKYINLNLDLLMLGACDFNFRDNIDTTRNKDIIWSSLLYYPTKNALGGHGNLYSLNFAKEFLKHKLTNEFKEFDEEYELFYGKYNIAICFPNIVITELTTTNNFHFFSPLSNGFKKYISNCFPESFTYLDYDYMTIDFIKFFLDNKCKTYKELVDKYCEKNKKCLVKNLNEILMNNYYSLDELAKIKGLLK
jgi:GR25 family glycosyltransferase involved in LPS biosynthesis